MQYKMINKLIKYIPYLYFILVILYVFTDINQSYGIYAYPILLFGFPILWQLFKPNKKLNFAIGLTFVYISSFLILAYLSDVLGFSKQQLAQGFIFYGGLFVLTNLVMAFWIIINSLRPRC